MDNGAKPGGTTFKFRNGATAHLQFVNYRTVGQIIAGARARFIEQHGEPICPKYTVETIGGDVEEYEHDETTVVDDRFKDDAELQEQWRLYSTLSKELQIYINTEQIRVLCVNGVMDVPPDAWLDEQRYWKRKLPDDPRDLRWEWLLDTAMGFPELRQCAVAIMRIKDPVEAAADAAAEGFRRKMGEAGTHAGGGARTSARSR